jgi:hypothetical protein
MVGPEHFALTLHAQPPAPPSQAPSLPVVVPTFTTKWTSVEKEPGIFDGAPNAGVNRAFYRGIFIYADKKTHLTETSSGVPVRKIDPTSRTMASTVVGSRADGDVD